MRRVIDKNFLMEKSKRHPLSIDDKGRHIRISNSKITFSIVGGTRGLYGDFINNFEVAVFDNETNNYVTRYYFPDNQEDVCGYLQLDELLEVLNKVFKEGFRVP